MMLAQTITMKNDTNALREELRAFLDYYQHDDRWVRENMRVVDDGDTIAYEERTATGWRSVITINVEADGTSVAITFCGDWREHVKGRVKAYGKTDKKTTD